MNSCGWTYAIADLPLATATGSQDWTALWVIAGIYSLGALGVYMVKAGTTR